MKKFISALFMASTIIPLTANAAWTFKGRTWTLPKKIAKAPKTCFKNKDFCVTSGVRDNGKLFGKKWVRVNVFARVSGFESADEVIELYRDYNEWGEYADNSGMNAVKFKKSVRMDDIEVNGKTVTPHYSNYSVKNVPLLGSMSVHEYSYNTELATPYKGAERSIIFALAPSKAKIPGFEGIRHPDGVKYKSGMVHIAECKECSEDEDEKVYNVYATVDVIPSIDFAMSLAVKPISKGIQSIFRGMLDL